MSPPRMKLRMPLRRVWMTLRSRASPKAWLPMKVIPEMPVFGPSVMTKTRFTRLFGSSIVSGVTDASKRAERR